MIQLQINRGEVEVHVGKQEVRVLMAELATGAVTTLDSIAYGIQVSPEVLLDDFIEMLKGARNEPDMWKLTKKEN